MMVSSPCTTRAGPGAGANATYAVHESCAVPPLKPGHGSVTTNSGEDDWIVTVEAEPATLEYNVSACFGEIVPPGCAAKSRKGGFGCVAAVLGSNANRTCNGESMAKRHSGSAFLQGQFAPQALKIDVIRGLNPTA